jgi:exodeoxyribonuclease VII small subunit
VKFSIWREARNIAPQVFDQACFNLISNFGNSSLHFERASRRLYDTVNYIVIRTKIAVMMRHWVKCPPLVMGIIKMAGKTPKALSFEAAVAELEQVVADMESGKLSLEDSLAAYQRGAELLNQCRARLDDAQQQVRILEDGVLKNFTDAAKAGDA